MNNLLDTPTQLDSLSAFLKFGPTGLAGLMLVLVIVALSYRTLTPTLERILTRFMYVGAFCFALALAANFFAIAGEYPLHFRVFPLDAGTKRSLPLPIIKGNNTFIDESNTYLVRSEVTAIVDVSDAINFVGEVRSQYNLQRQALSEIISVADSLVADLQRVPEILHNNCPGGSSGRPAASNPAVVAITSRAATIVASFKTSSAAAIAEQPPEVKHK